MTQPLSRRQEEVLTFIKAEVYSGRPFPNSGQIAKRLGCKSRASAQDYLRRLQAKGYVSGHPIARGCRTMYVWKLV